MSHEDFDQLEEKLETRATKDDVDDLEKRFEKLQSMVNAPGGWDRGRGAVRIPSSLTPTNWALAILEEGFLGTRKRRSRIAEDWQNLQQRVRAGEIETRDFWPELETRALADVTGGQDGPGDKTPASDLSGLVVEEFMADQLVHILNRRRPVFSGLGTMQMPRSGYARIPTVTQHTVVKARGDQKTEAPTGTMIVSTSAYEAEWIAGAVDIALELIRSAHEDENILRLVADDLFGQYAKATEEDTTIGQHGNPVGVVPFIEAGGHGFTYTNTALDLTDYEAFVADVYEGMEEVEDATDNDATVLFVTRTQFRTIAGFVDADGRPQFPPVRPTNADATRGFNATRIQLPDGPTIIKARSNSLTQAVLTNSEAFKVADGGPEQIGPVRNVALMGDDVGVLGRTMLVPRIPEGVVVFGTEPS